MTIAKNNINFNKEREFYILKGHGYLLSLSRGA